MAGLCLSFPDTCDPDLVLEGLVYLPNLVYEKVAFNQMQKNAVILFSVMQRRIVVMFVELDIWANIKNQFALEN